MNTIRGIIFRPLANRFDIGNQILSSVVVSKFAKDKMTTLVLYVIVAVLRAHILALICCMVSINPYVDFIVSIFLSVLSVIYSNILYIFAENFRPYVYMIVRHSVNNYTPQNFRKWKIFGITFVCMYAIIILQFIELTSPIIIMYLVQYMITYFTVDVIDQNNFETMVAEYKSRPTKVIHEKLNIIENFHSPKNDEYPDIVKNSVSFIVLDGYIE